jgi:hypothetical protein
MSNDYLWDRSGPPDPEIQRLEEIMATLRHPVPRPAYQRAWWPAAIAAMVMIGVASWQFFPAPTSTRTAWTVASVDGSPTLGKQIASPSATLYTGQMLRTDSASKATIAADNFGSIDVAPDSELRVVESGSARQRFDLRRGLIHAFIWAPPGQFVVDTASSRAIDLGCQYTLSVDANGNGIVDVESGWVAFQFEGREAFIPAGAACLTSARRGPGTPYFRDAPDALREALRAFDETGDVAVLRRVLSEARPRDALTLWHLLSQVPPGERPAVFDRFAQVAPLPPQVTRENALKLDRRTIDLCWNALNLENTKWWRGWKRQWQ